MNEMARGRLDQRGPAPDMAHQAAIDEALGMLLEYGGHLGDPEDLAGRALPAPWEERILQSGGGFSESVAREALRQATARFEANPRAIYRCRGETCRRLDPDPLTHPPDELPLRTSGCQGHCEAGPRATLCFDGAQRAFGPLDHEAWLKIDQLLRRAQREDTLLVDDDPTRDFSFDPVHAHSTPDLSDFEFLVGNFRGEGHYGESERPFRKQVAGRWVAGGSAIALRMEVAYPLPGGGVDAHEGLVVIGAERSGDDFLGRAWTDGGSCLEYRYQIDPDSGALVFSDRPPGHGHSARRARKLLVPQPGGYEERLEVEGESGGFSTYSTLVLRRQS